MIKLAINGASGRVGRRLIALAKADSKFQLVSATCSPGSRHLHSDAGELAGIGSIGLVLSSAIGNHPEVVVDFSHAFWCPVRTRLLHFQSNSAGRRDNRTG